MQLVTAAVFVVTFLLVAGMYWVFILRPENVGTRRVRDRLKVRKRPSVLVRVAKEKEQLSAVGPLNQLLSRTERIADPIRRLLARSGLAMTVGTVVLASIFAATVGLAAGAILTGSITAGAVAGLLMASVPLLYVRRAVNKRLARFEEQFPEAIELIARSLRAGHALTTALQLVGQEIAEPVGGEFRMLFESQNFGMSLTEALREFGVRVPLVDARFFVTAVQIQREMGGNLSQVLDNLATVIRERFTVKRQVRVMSAHGRITGWALGSLPPVVGVVLFLLAPEHMRLLFTDPLGIRLVLGAVILQTVGVLAIRRIVDVEY